ncbi:MAG: D-alanyl-D-alanine carboxypeptidase family protein [Mycoplasmatota bacterium]
MKKFIAFICLFCIFPFSTYALDLAPSASSVILLEPTTGEIIYERDSDVKLNPASMTKMMSMLLIVEAIEDGLIAWDDMVRVSANAASMGGSQILLEENEEMSVEDLFKGVTIASGNDAVVALAEKVAGTEEQFVLMMNERASELGLENTVFQNPHGLDEANHYSTAYDMAIIASELVSHEVVLEYTSIYETYLREDTDQKIWLVNTNKLVRFYEGMDGLKTGYTTEAGYCLTATAMIGNTRFIAVVMGEPDSNTRNAEMTEIMDYAFSQYEIETLISKDTTIELKQIDKSVNRVVEIVPLEDINVLNLKTGENENISYDVFIDKIDAPLSYGDVVGNVTLDDGRVIELTVKEDVVACNLFQLFIQTLSDIVTGEIIY